MTDAEIEADVVRFLAGGPIYEGLMNGRGESEAIGRLIERGSVKRAYMLGGMLAKVELVK